MKVKGNTNLQIIQGDTFGLSIKLQNVDYDTIEKIIFSSATLGISKEFQKRENDYYLELSCGETCILSKIVCCYDITAFFIGNKTKTLEYRGTISVLEKVNKTDIEINIPVPDGYVKPEGTIEINNNGEFDISNYKKVKVLVFEGFTPEGTLEINKNGEFNVSAYEKANVQIPNEIPENYIIPEGIKYISNNGEHAVREYEKVNVQVPNETPEGYIKPEGTLEITENGEFNVNTYEKVNVQVPNEPTAQDFTNEDGLMTRTLTNYYNDRITFIGDRVFQNYSTPLSINCPNVKQIGINCFYGSTGLIEFKMQSLVTFGANALYQCSNLKVLNLPNVETIPASSCRYCTSLEVVYASKIKNVASAVFGDCTNLTTFILGGTSVVKLETINAFVRTPIESGTGFVYVLDTLLESYRVATNWSTIADQIKPYSELPQEIKEALGL